MRAPYPRPRSRTACERRIRKLCRNFSATSSPSESFSRPRRVPGLLRGPHRHQRRDTPDESRSTRARSPPARRSILRSSPAPWRDPAPQRGMRGHLQSESSRRHRYPREGAGRSNAISRVTARDVPSKRVTPRPGAATAGFGHMSSIASPAERLSLYRHPQHSARKLPYSCHYLSLNALPQRGRQRLPPPPSMSFVARPPAAIARCLRPAMKPDSRPPHFSSPPTRWQSQNADAIVSIALARRSEAEGRRRSAQARSSATNPENPRRRLPWSAQTRLGLPPGGRSSPTRTTGTALRRPLEDRTTSSPAHRAEWRCLTSFSPYPVRTSCGRDTCGYRRRIDEIWVTARSSPERRMADASSFRYSETAVRRRIGDRKRVISSNERSASSVSRSL